MGDTPTTGAVKIVLKLDTADAKAKADEVERKLRNNERQRRFVTERINKDGFGAKTGSSNMGQTIADKMLERVLPKTGGYNPFNAIGPIPKMVAAFQNALAGKPTQHAVGTGQGGMAPQIGNLLGRLGNFSNPFPRGGVSGANAAGGAGSTLLLAAALYKGLEKGALVGAKALSYFKESGAKASESETGKFLSELNGTFSYMNHYFASWKDSFTRAYEWDSTVAAVTGKLPDTYFYRSKFSRQSQFEKEFQDLMSRNAAQTRAGAVGASDWRDQMRDSFFRAMSR